MGTQRLVWAVQDALKAVGPGGLGDAEEDFGFVEEELETKLHKAVDQCRLCTCSNTCTCLMAVQAGCAMIQDVLS